MAKLKFTRENVETLDIKTDLAYEVLKRGVDTNSPALISSAECLYSNDIEKYLAGITRRATENFRHLRKGGKRAEEIERYILQCILMSYQSLWKGENRHTLQINENLEDGMGGLKAYIDVEDPKGAKESEAFRLIQDKSMQLRTEGRYDLILKAIEYVTKKGASINTIADTFCGCGTTAYEASRNGIDYWGCDINPVATLIAYVKSKRYSINKLDY